LTNEREWKEVDSYFARTLIGSEPALEEALAANAAAGLPSIDVSAPQGKLIHLLARMAGARKALEIGALGGYSTIWLARALPDDGRLITLEVSARHADVARRNLARAGLGGKVEIRTGAALTTLPKIEAEGLGPFDFVFIDADKSSYLAYYEALLPKLSPDGLMAADNTLWSGRVVDASDQSEDTVAIRAFNDAVARDGRVVCVQLTVRDGVTLIRRAPGPGGASGPG
jgi:predicted O-methyltransferase YrrM